GDLRVSLTQSREFMHLSDVDQLHVRERFFYDKLPKVEQDLQNYRSNLEQNQLDDARLGDRSEERRTVEELEAALANLKKSKIDQAFVFVSAQADAVGHTVEEMYAKASGLQAKMHDRMRGFVDEARSEYRTWIITEWTATIATIIFLPVAMWLFYDWLFQPLE